MEARELLLEDKIIIIRKQTKKQNQGKVFRNLITPTQVFIVC